MPGECNCHDSYAGSNCEIGTVTTLQTTLQTTVTTLQTTFILYSAKFCAKCAPSLLLLLCIMAQFPYAANKEKLVKKNLDKSTKNGQLE